MHYPFNDVSVVVLIGILKDFISIHFVPTIGNAINSINLYQFEMYINS